jgi:Alpha/beta hydrolase family
MKPTALLALVVPLLAGCGLAEPTRGTPITATVASALFEVRANKTDVVPITVVFPATADGAPDLGTGPRRGVVFIQGGLVGPERYVWQAVELAKHGYVVALPQHPLDLAFFSIDNGLAAQRLLADPPPRSLLEGLVDGNLLGVGGHSLGGVVAVKLALAGGFRALQVQASFPDGADTAKLPTLAMPSQSIVGSNDCSAKFEPVKAGWESLPAPSALVVVKGGTHYQWTDSEAEDLKRGCAAGVSLEEAHADYALATVSFFDAALSDSASLGVGALAGNAAFEVTTR